MCQRAQSGKSRSNLLYDAFELNDGSHHCDVRRIIIRNYVYDYIRLASSGSRNVARENDLVDRENEKVFFEISNRSILYTFRALRFSLYSGNLIEFYLIIIERYSPRVDER